MKELTARQIEAIRVITGASDEEISEALRLWEEWKEDAPVIYYKIVGPRCGRDINGEFSCVCGKCEPLPSDQGDICDYSGCDGGNGRNRRNDRIQNKSSLFSALFRGRGLH